MKILYMVEVLLIVAWFAGFMMFGISPVATCPPMVTLYFKGCSVATVCLLWYMVKRG